MYEICHPFHPRVSINRESRLSNACTTKKAGAPTPAFYYFRLRSEYTGAYSCLLPFATIKPLAGNGYGNARQKVAKEINHECHACKTPFLIASIGRQLSSLYDLGVIIASDVEHKTDPCHCGGGLFLLQVCCKLLLLPVASAYRTAGLVWSGSVVEVRLPDMTFGALPPDLQATSWQHLIRCKVSIQRWVPLARDLWIDGRKVIESLEQLPVGAIWTACRPFLARSVAGGGLVSVALVALPPDFPVGAHGDLIGREIAVQRRMPFRRNVRPQRGEVVESLENLLAVAYRTVVFTGMRDTIPDHRLE